MTMQTDILASKPQALAGAGASVNVALKDQQNNNVGRCRVKGIFVSIAAGSVAGTGSITLNIREGSTTGAIVYTQTYYADLNANMVPYTLLPGEGILVEDTPYLDVTNALAVGVPASIVIFYG